MIPPIIHYTWFSGDPFPEKIQRCIDSWYKYMPNYEYVLWDSQRIREIHSVWLDECLEQRKWAFAADMVRLYAVYHYGGIYLDTDCFIYRSFDDLLGEACFIGKENSIHVEGRSTQMYLTSHCFGAEKGNSFIERCLSYYCDRHFKVSEDDSFPMNLKFSTLLLPYIQCEFAKQIGYNPYPSMDEVQRLENVTIFPRRYFDVTKVSRDAYCKHLALGGWREDKRQEERYTVMYKIEWRLRYCMEWVLRKFGYIMIKLR